MVSKEKEKQKQKKPWSENNGLFNAGGGNGKCSLLVEDLVQFSFGWSNDSL
jgi:hypothetical protein